MLKLANQNFSSVNEIKETILIDKEVKESVDNFVKETQEIASNIVDMDNQQEEIKDSLYELQQNLADKSLEFQERVYNAVVKSREDEIANLTTINESIKENNKQIQDCSYFTPPISP